MNDARNKLRSMGGIMASSPELMQAATQRFQNGGLAMTTAPMAPVRPAMQYNDIMRPQMEPPVVGLGRVEPVRPAGLPDRLPTGLASFSMQDWRKMNRKERKAAGLPVSELGAQLFFDRFGVGLGLVEPDARYTSEGPVETEAERLMAGSSANQLVDNIDDLRAARGFGRSAYLSGLKGNVVDIPEDTTPFDTSRENKAEVLAEVEQKLAEENAKRPTPDTFASTAQKRRIEKLEDTKSRLEGQQTKPTEEDLMAQEVAPSMTPEQMTEEGRKALEGLVPQKSEDPAEAEKIAQDAMSVLLKTQQPTGDGEETPAKTLEDYYKDARALISKVYGEVGDVVDNRMINLAMIGLAIAAGQSPNALINIAQGLLVGTQGMAQRREAERDRERGLRTLALETAIAQQGAATEAEAEAARMDIEQQNRLELEREKARLNREAGGNQYGTATNPISAAIRLLQGKQAAAGDITTPLGRRVKDLSPEDRRIVLLEEVQKDLMPIYGPDTPSLVELGSIDTGTATGTEISEEDAAKALGL